MSVRLLWDASTDTVCWDIHSDDTDDIDFTDMGGLQNTAAASGKTGDIQLTTTGHTSADTYVIVLNLVKEY